MSKTVYEFTARTITGEETTLRPFEGKVLLIVNTASKCGLTPQYKGLEQIYQDYKDRGVVVMGFPCNQFGGQEPGNEVEIQSFCELNHGVTFPLFSKIEVNGDDTHPLFVHLKRAAKGLLGTERIKWNFTKFLVDREGHVVKRFAPTERPEAIATHIEALI